MNNININEKAKAVAETMSGILSEKKLTDILILTMLILCTFLTIDAIIVSIRGLFGGSSLSTISIAPLTVLPWMVASLAALLFLRHWINK